MLCTIEDVLSIPGMANVAARPTAWLNSLIGAADAHLRSWCKQNLELAYYTDYYSGHDRPNLVCRELPVLVGQTTFDASMDGQALPQATITVSSTAGFHPGLGGGTSDAIRNPPPGFSIRTGINSYAYVTYTGTTSTTFTGCSGGTGTLDSDYDDVFSPVAWHDSTGFYGQSADAFPQDTQLVLGNNYVVEYGHGATRKLSKRGLIKRIGGSGAGFIGFYPETYYSGKLAARRLPCWPRGDGNIKLAYAAGYPAYSRELREISYACAMLVAQMIRIQPSGVDLSNESMGNYSYSAKSAFDSPEMGEVRRVLAPYREISVGND